MPLGSRGRDVSWRKIGTTIPGPRGIVVGGERRKKSGSPSVRPEPPDPCSNLVCERGRVAHPAGIARCGAMP